MNNNKIIAKNTAILFFRLLFTSVLGLLTSRFIIRSLGASDYGLYNVVGQVVIMMGFLNIVMTSTTYRYIAFEIGKGDDQQVNKVFNISLIIHLCLALLVLIVTETLGVFYVNNYLNVVAEKLSDALFVMRFSTYTAVFSIISIPYIGLITAQEKFGVQVKIEIIRSILGFIIAILIVFYSGNKLRLYSILLVAVSIIPSSMFIMYCKKEFNKYVKWSFQNDFSKYKEMLSFSGWILFGAAANVGQKSGAAMIVNAFFGTMLNAALGIANQVNNIVRMFSQNIGHAAIPQIIKSFSSGDTNRTINIAAYISKYTMFLMLLPALPVLLETKYLLRIWLGDVPEYTIIFTQLLIINTLIKGLGSGLSAVVQATGKIKYFQIILGTTSLLSLPIAYFIFKNGHPPPYITIVFISTAILNVVIRQILLSKIINFNVKFFLKTSYIKILYVLLVILPIFFVRSILKAGTFRFFIISILAELFLVIAIYSVGIDKHERKTIHKFIKYIYTKYV